MASMAIGAGLGAAGGIISALNSGPSAAMENLNSQIQDFTKFVAGQAKSEGLDASQVFKTVMGPLTRIIQGGPQQAGWSNAQVSNYNASQVQRGAAEARDMGAFANNNPGSKTAATLAAQQKAEQDVSSGISQGEVASTNAGREEFNSAIGGAEKATEAFNPANAAASEVKGQQELAAKSQQNIDTQKRSASWSGILSKALSGAGGSMMGGKSGGGLGGMINNGVGNTSGDSSFGENVGNFAKGALGTQTGGTNGPSVMQKAMNTPVATSPDNSYSGELIPSAQ
jgi:hypothetical protein